jgi:hypothetical protein
MIFQNPATVSSRKADVYAYDDLSMMGNLEKH